MRPQEREKETRPDGTIVDGDCVFLLFGSWYIRVREKGLSLESISDLEYYDVHLHFGRPRKSSSSSLSGLARRPAAA